MPIYKFLVSIWLLSSGIAIAANPVPLIGQPLIPDAATPGAAGFTLTLHGAGFVPTSVVRWNGVRLATTFVNAAQLTATVPAANVASVGTATVIVFNPAPGGGKSNVVFFQVIAPTSTAALLGSTINLGNPASFVASADFNHDGKLDLAAVEFGSPGIVWILLGNGDGTFQIHSTINLLSGTSANAFAVGDFNGDGNPDLVIGAASGNSNVAYVMFGIGDGTFQSPGATSALTQVPWNLAAADLNGDGKLDLVAGYRDGSAFSVVLGNGDGTFGPPNDYTADSGPSSIFLADFNGDGIIDIATADMFSSNFCCSILLGKGDGTFLPAQNMGPESFPVGITGGDFNHDGNVDLAVVTTLGVLTFLGNGDGTFTEAAGGATGGPALNASIATGDFNADGNLDVVLPTANSNVSILLGNGDGSFQAPIVVPAGGQTVAVAVGDFNRDGHLDVATADDPGGVSVLLQSTLLIAPTTLQFSVTVVGMTSSPQSVKVTNFGAAPVKIGTITVTGGNSADFPIQTNCGAFLAPGKSCSVIVQFKPAADGVRSATLTIPNASINLAQTIPLSGQATIVEITPGSLNFGTVPVGQTSPAQTVTLKNVGSVAVQINRINITNTEFGQTNTCPTSLAAGASCDVMVTFTPNATGLQKGSLSISNTGGVSPQTVSLSGTGS